MTSTAEQVNRNDNYLAATELIFDGIVGVLVTVAFLPRGSRRRVVGAVSNLVEPLARAEAFVHHFAEPGATFFFRRLFDGRERRTVLTIKEK